MSNAHFARTPNISIPRTKMKQSFTHKTSFQFGKLIPIDAFEVLPGDTFKLKLSSLIRMSTPIAPIMDNIECSIHAFFVPMRLIWEHAEEFYGANKTSAGYQQTNYTIPSVLLDLNDSGVDGPEVMSVCDYLGKPLALASDTAEVTSVSILKERAYALIWNEWYLAEQVMNPIIINKGDRDGTTDYFSDGAIGSRNGTDWLPTSKSGVLPVCKKFDYFTAATIAPQYGEAVLLPLGAEAPIKFDPAHEGEDYITVLDDGDWVGFDGSLSTVYGEGGRLLDSSDQPVAIDNSKHLYADLSQATAATVNDIRYAFQVQKYLERSNFGSNRFFEILANHYGVTSPDARLQRPEYLGGHKFLINVNQVLSTAGQETGSTTKLGATGAVSVTGDIVSLFTKGFVEPGYVMILLDTKQDHTYSQGVLREDSRQTRFEFYSPEFANLGDQEIKNKEIFAGTEEDDGVFGYQEHWAEYRYRPDRVSGLLNPNASESLDFWTLADKFATLPRLNEQFITENRSNIARALATGETGPDFIADFYFDYTAVRPMPAYTIPGLIDHFGAM